VIIDAFDYDIKGTKLEKFMKKNLSKDFMFVMSKSDMLDSDDEIKDQLKVVETMIKKI
jgi:hypothetical protein